MLKSSFSLFIHVLLHFSLPIYTALGRLAWIEARAGETPDSSRHSTTDTAPIESHTVRNGTSFDDESTKRRKLEAAPGGGSDSWPVQKAEKGEASFQDEVEWLSQQMEDVQRRVYRKIEVHQLRSSQVLHVEAR